MLLVFGHTGQVATEIKRLVPGATFLDRAAADLSDPEGCARAIAKRRPEAVINAAAWTAVDKAETEEAAATLVNGEAPAAMARACARLGIPFVHISTDYVFDGTRPCHSSSLRHSIRTRGPFAPISSDSE
jgi:dTDP-4-dehydrorhamnose reductase